MCVYLPIFAKRNKEENKSQGNGGGGETREERGCGRVTFLWVPQTALPFDPGSFFVALSLSLLLLMDVNFIAHFVPSTILFHITQLFDILKSEINSKGDETTLRIEYKKKQMNLYQIDNGYTEKNYILRGIFSKGKKELQRNF